MKLALDQAGSRFIGWIDSCLSCLVPVDDDESFHHEQAMKGRGDEREMKVCHSQPHLVPPMGPVALNPPPRRSRPYASLPSWAIDGKDRLSRASIRTSISRGRSTTAPLRISLPSEFRKVDSFVNPGPEPYSPYSPLELSIHSPGKRLSTLPNFEDFQLGGNRPQPIAPPPRVLSLAQRSCSQSYRPGVSHQLIRKPVRSGPRQPSLSTLEQPEQRPAPNPLIPHFSTLSPTSARVPEHISPVPGLSTSYDVPITPAIQPREPQRPRTPRTPTTSKQDRPLPPLPPPSPSPSTSPKITATISNPPRTPNPQTPTTKSLHSSRTPQRYSTPGYQNQSQSLHSTPSKSTSIEKVTPGFHARARTLSGSTLASSTSGSTWTGNLKPTPSRSSTITARPSFSDTRMEKELELVMSRPYTPKRVPAVSVEERTYPYPPIYEQQQQHQQGQDEYNRYYAKYRESAIGVAF